MFPSVCFTNFESIVEFLTTWRRFINTFASLKIFLGKQGKEVEKIFNGIKARMVTIPR